jgi:hypothetical protein
MPPPAKTANYHHFRVIILRAFKDFMGIILEGFSLKL